MTGNNGRRRRGAPACPSGAARRQGSDLQERRTGRRIQHSDKLGSAGVLKSGAVEPRHGDAPVDWQSGCAGYLPTWYMAAKLSAWQEGAALKTLSLRAPGLEGWTTPGLGGHRRHGTPTTKHNKGSTVQMQRQEYNKRLPRMVGTGPQSRPQIHPPPPRQGARQPRWGERRGPREQPGERVGARGRGRGRARGWHTRVTARHRRGGQTYRQGRQREGEWEGRQAGEGAQGSETRVAWRRAGGTRRARGSSKEREHRKEKKQQLDRRVQRKGTKRRQGAGGGGNRGPTRAQRNTMSDREAPCR